MPAIWRLSPHSPDLFRPKSNWQNSNPLNKNPMLFSTELLEEAGSNSQVLLGFLIKRPLHLEAGFL
jgi:hypothetical protein